VSTLLYERFDGYAVFTMNRPNQLNAQNLAFWHELGEAVDEFNGDPGMRAGILTGAGRAFSAGRDLKEVAARAAGGLPSVDIPEAAREMLSRSPKPFIAAVNGLAVGGGMERALDCDIRLASPEAYFSLPEPRHGLVAPLAVHHLVSAIPSGTALALLLTGERLSAARAYEIGLVQEVVDRERLIDRCVELARQIVAASPVAIEVTKRAALRARSGSLDDARRIVTAASERLAEERDRRVAAFAAAQNGQGAGDEQDGVNDERDGAGERRDGAGERRDWAGERPPADR